MTPIIIHELEMPALRPFWVQDMKSVDKDEMEFALPWTMKFVRGSVLYTLAVQPGFRTDGLSCPAIAWQLIDPPFSPMPLPGVAAHDSAYAAEVMPREICDDLFETCLHFTGVCPDKVEFMMRFVRRAGGIIWDRHTPESIADARQYVSLTPQWSPA